jgi:hypothetical protein
MKNHEADQTNAITQCCSMAHRSKRGAANDGNLRQAQRHREVANSLILNIRSLTGNDRKTEDVIESLIAPV